MSEPFLKSLTAGCTECAERVINLDVVSVDQAWTELRANSSACLHASSESDNVIFLEDRPLCLPETNPNDCPDDNEVVIYTARSIDQINRAANMGYWPDVRWVEYKGEHSTLMSSSINIFQDETSGRLVVLDNAEDPRLYSRPTIPQGCKEVIAERHFYPRYQEQPIAAYLIPIDLPDGTEVVVSDPIEDIVNGWERAFAVPAIVRNRKVILELDKVEVRHIVG